MYMDGSYHVIIVYNMDFERHKENQSTMYYFKIAYETTITSTLVDGEGQRTIHAYMDKLVYIVD